jgi:transposase InsO family protein
MAVTRSQTAKAKTDHDQQIVEPSVNDNPKITSSTWLKQYSKDCIRNEQEKDSVISKVLNYFKTSNIKPEWQTISHEGRQFKQYWSFWDQLRLHDNILYKIHYDEVTLSEKLLLVVPKSLVQEVLTELHTTLTSGHLGRNKTLGKVQSRFYWVGWRDDVVKFCQQCSECSQKKPPPKKNRAPLKQYLVGEPLERIGLDILGPFPKTYSGNKYILVLVDYFTKWSEAYPMRNMEASTIAKKLVDGFITTFGVPQEIHTDQGRQFESKLFQGLCSNLGIHKTRTTPLNPQSDGLVERYNRTLTTMLSHFVDKNQKDWDIYVPVLNMAYRATPQESTNVTPNMLMLGREVNLPIDIIYGKPPNTEIFQDDEYVDQLRERLENAYEYARTHLKKSALRQKTYYNQKIHGSSFVKGDFVWWNRPKRNIGLCPKLQKPWDGPFLVLKKINDSIYQIQKDKNSEKKIVHFNRLKLYEGMKIDSWENPVCSDPGFEGGSSHTSDKSSNDCELESCSHDKKWRDGTSSSADSSGELGFSDNSRPTQSDQFKARSVSECAHSGLESGGTPLEDFGLSDVPAEALGVSTESGYSGLHPQLNVDVVESGGMPSEDLEHIGNQAEVVEKLPIGCSNSGNFSPRVGLVSDRGSESG